MPGTELDLLFRERRSNALVGWAIVALFVVVAVEEVLTGDLLWGAFVFVGALLASLPAIAYRNFEVMPPWEVLALTAPPVLGRAFATLDVTSAFTTYLAVATFALLIAVELQAFTPTKMTIGFAVLFVVVTTMATAGIWAVARWVLAGYGPTSFLITERTAITSEHALMWEFVYSTVAGVGAGVVFEFYFRRRARAHDRLPSDVVSRAGGESP
jgi:hypothetical protein